MSLLGCLVKRNSPPSTQTLAHPLPAPFPPILSKQILLHRQICSSQEQNCYSFSKASLSSPPIRNLILRPCSHTPKSSPRGHFLLRPSPCAGLCSRYPTLLYSATDNVPFCLVPPSSFHSWPLSEALYDSQYPTPRPQGSHRPSMSPGLIIYNCYHMSATKSCLTGVPSHTHIADQVPKSYPELK